MMFKRFRNLILILGVLTALLPSLSVGLGLIDLPPELEQRIAYVIGFVGVIVFMTVLIARERLLRLAQWKQIGLVVFSAIFGLALVFWIATIADSNLRYFDDRRFDQAKTVAYLLPENSQYSAQLRTLVDGRYRGNLDVAIRSEPERVLELMATDSWSLQVKFMALLALAQAFVTFALMFGGFAAVQSVGSEADEVISLET